MLGMPHIHASDCMNHRWDPQGPVCTRCQEACPAGAIAMVDGSPRINDACTGCMACVSICPTAAIGHERLDIAALVRQARVSVMQGRQILRAACAFAADASADIQVPCHAAWNPLLLSCLAGEGVHMLETDGIAQCASCPVRHGSHMLSQTERDYAAFSKGLEVRLVLSREITRKAPVTKKRQEPEPERRAFFRKLIPTLAQGAAMTVAQISEAMRDDAVHTEAQDGPTQSPSLRLFTKALARLRPNFTPVPHLPSVPLGTVQADARCNACGQCVAECPTEALTLRPFGAQQVLEFQPDTCIGCEHCADICPEHAITQLPSVSLPAIAAGRSRPLVMVGANRKPDPQALAT